jgi:hypothetical protein
VYVVLFALVGRFKVFKTDMKSAVVVQFPKVAGKGGVTCHDGHCFVMQGGRICRHVIAVVAQVLLARSAANPHDAVVPIALQFVETLNRTRWFHTRGGRQLASLHSL